MADKRSGPKVRKKEVDTPEKVDSPGQQIVQYRKAVEGDDSFFGITKTEKNQRARNRMAKDLEKISTWGSVAAFASAAIPGADVGLSAVLAVTIWVVARLIVIKLS